MIYPIGSYIVYGSEGVCKIEDIGQPNISTITNENLYYTLSSIFHPCKIYIPVTTNKPIRPVISEENAQNLIELLPEIKEQSMVDSNVKNLSDHYQEILHSHNCKEILTLIKSTYIKKQRLSVQGKKLGSIDEQFMKHAEDVLYGEFSVALGISIENVKKTVEASLQTAACS